MQALIVHDDPTEAARLEAAIARRGFLVRVIPDQETAIAHVRRMPADLLILKQVMGGRHTTSVALAGELHNPGLATILLSGRKREDAVELFELIPSLHAILGPEPNTGLLTTLAVQAVRSAVTPVLVLEPQARVATGTHLPAQIAAHHIDAA